MTNDLAAGPTSCTLLLFGYYELSLLTIPYSLVLLSPLLLHCPKPCLSSSNYILVIALRMNKICVRISWRRFPSDQLNDFTMGK